MYKVLAISNWADSESITKRLLQQFYIGQDLSDIEFVHSGDADFVFNFGYEIGGAQKYTQKYIFSMEPTWSGAHPKNIGDKDAIIFSQNTSVSSLPNNVVECPTFMFYGSGGENWTYDDVLAADTIQKTKDISSVVSNLRRGAAFPCIYEKRCNVVEAILKSKAEVDVYSWDTSVYSNAKGWLNKKVDGVRDYRFSLAIENTHEKNYVSEKFYDPILMNTIPIYFGATNIQEIFPETGYFLISDIDDTDEILYMLSYIKANADALYNKMLPEARKIKARFFSEFNILTKMLTLIHGDSQL